jgi:hypothetical protein
MRTNEVAFISFCCASAGTVAQQTDPDLLRAAATGEIAQVRELVDAGRAVNGSDWTPLQSAAYNSCTLCSAATRKPSS